MLKHWTERLETPLVIDSTPYVVRVISSERADHTWDARLAFFAPNDGNHRPFVTGVETTQPDEDAVKYWATGLQPVYLEGALRRAERAARPRSRRIDNLEAVDLFVLDLFHQHEARRLPVDQIFAEGGTYANADLIRSMQHLERLRLILRITEQGKEVVYLTS